MKETPHNNTTMDLKFNRYQGIKDVIVALTELLQIKGYRLDWPFYTDLATSISVAPF